MSYRMAPNVECMIVADEHGKLWHHYQRPAVGISRGPIIQYLNDQQRESFLRNRLVVEIDDRDMRSIPAAADAGAEVPAPKAELVDECIRDLDRLGVAPTAGAPTARTALREAGIQFGNDVVCAAVRARKQQVAAAADSR